MNWKVMVVLVSVAVSATVISTYSVYQCQKKQMVAFKEGYVRTDVQQGVVYNDSWVKPQDNSVTERMVNTIADLATYVKKDSQVTQRVMGEINAIKQALENKRDKR